MKVIESEPQKYGAGFLVVIAGALAWIVYRKKRGQGLRSREKHPQTVVSVSGADSDFYRIVEYLKEKGKERYAWEPLTDWIQRIKGSGPAAAGMDSLEPILALHYRFRFDPKTLSETERETLKSGVQNWLEEFSRLSTEQEG